MSPWLKAGLIGGVVLIVLNALGLIACVGLFTCILGIFAYAAIGVLAAYWLPPMRMAGQGAGQGALAAVLAALIGGIVNTIIAGIQMAVADTSIILEQLPPDMVDQLYAAGIDLDLFVGPAGGIMTGSMCCIAGLIIAAILGAIGGAIFAAVKPD